MTKVVVLGATGFIGRGVVPELERAGLGVVAPTGRSGTSRSELDLRDPQADWSARLAGADVVVNLAGKAHDVRRLNPDDAADYFAVNATGAGRLAAAVRAAGAKRFVQISTIKVLGAHPSDGRRFREADPLDPVGLYAESKALGEQEVARALQDSATECVIIRLPLVFGQPFKGNLALIERAIRLRVPLPLADKRIGARTYVRLEDLARLLVKVVAAPGPLPAIMHARSEPDLKAGDVARLVGASIGRKPVLVSVPPSALRGVAKALRRPELASKLCDEMLVSDEATRASLIALER